MNISESMNRLLSMYHPKDGVTAYERVLKALLVLLENFDASIQQLISFIPLPSGVPEEQIKDAIRRTTGLVVTSLPFSHKLSTDHPKTEQSAKMVNQYEGSGTNVNFRQMESGEKYYAMGCQNSERLLPAVPEVFRGFPANEISMVHSHVKNLNSTYDSLDQTRLATKSNYRPMDQQPNQLKSGSGYNWYCAPRGTLYRNETQSQYGCVQPLEGKCLHVPFNKIHNYSQYSLASTTKTYAGAASRRNELILNKFNGNRVFNLKMKRDDKSGQEATSTETRKEETRRNFDLDTLKQLAEEGRMDQQAIREDLYKMDVVRWNEKNQDGTITTEDAKWKFPSLTENLVARAKLKTCISSFLKRSGEEYSVDVPATVRRNLEINERSDNGVNQTEKPEQSGKSRDDVGASGDRSACRRIGAGSCAKVGQCDTIDMQVLEKRVDCRTKENACNSTQRYGARQTDTKASQQQAASVNELAAYKKQYYDTLLCIQKAKVAVANSLAMSSVESSTRYDPYYTSYSYQQQQLLRRQEQLTARPEQFAVHAAVQQPGLSAVPYGWLRCNNWRQPFVGQFKLRSQSPHPRNKEWMPRCKRTTGNSQCFMQERGQQAKQCVQRKKLEDIVGKLKETEHGNSQC